MHVIVGYWNGAGCGAGATGAYGVYVKIALKLGHCLGGGGTNVCTYCTGDAHETGDGILAHETGDGIGDGNGTGATTGTGCGIRRGLCSTSR